MLGAAGVALAFGNVAPWVLRRPLQYEVAIAAAFCFLQAGLLLALTGAFRDRPDWRRLGGASLCLGLAFMSRPPLGIGAAALVALLVWWRRSGELAPGPPTRRAAMILLGPFAACVIAFAVFNAVRFGSPANFGIKDQLAGDQSQDQRAVRGRRISGPGSGTTCWRLCAGGSSSRSCSSTAARAHRSHSPPGTSPPSRPRGCCRACRYRFGSCSSHRGRCATGHENSA